MINHRHKEISYNEGISADEYEVIRKFISSYEDQEFIIADKHIQLFDKVPLDYDGMIFKISGSTEESMELCKRIYHMGKQYIVTLELNRTDLEGGKKATSINQFIISTEDKEHCIELHNIMEVFNRKKIISPAEAYGSKMINDKALQKFIDGHEWQKIEKGLNEAPDLASALFKIREGYDEDRNDYYNADFGTILYQLIKFRQENIDKFTEKDLLELDKLIVKLRKTELLKIRLMEYYGGCKSWPTSTSLLECDNTSDGMQISNQYNVSNMGLSSENKTLAECVNNFKK